MKLSIQERAARMRGTKRKRTNALCRRLNHKVQLIENSGKETAAHERLLRMTETTREKFRNLDYSMKTERVKQTCESQLNHVDVQELFGLLAALAAQVELFRPLVKRLESATSPTAEPSSEMRYAFNVV